MIIGAVQRQADAKQATCVVVAPKKGGYLLIAASGYSL
jgi:hypothetical protein